MSFRALVFFGVLLGLLAVGAFAQNCRPGSVDCDSVRVYARVTGSLTGSASPQGPGQESAGSPAPGLGLVQRSKVAEVQTGMNRASVEAVLGKPHSVMAIHGDEEVETLIYNLDDKATARVRTINGKVVSVRLSTD